jgi:hypothetical protein
MRGGSFSEGSREYAPSMSFIDFDWAGEGEQWSDIIVTPERIGNRTSFKSA